ncbi:TPA: hypothetical protein HA251_05200 [Candidatus Woesearchaeota archaeon]|nr:hypothetical protein [Candidatus Woesearchaeota archaeon]
MTLRVQYSSLINQGAYAFVFAVSSDIAVKVFKSDMIRASNDDQKDLPASRYQLSCEERVMRALRTNDVSVPEPHGIRAVTLEFPTRTMTAPGLLMERIHGQTIYSLGRNPEDERLFDYATALWNTELVKARRICDIEDAHDENALYDARKGKVYLLDFIGWTIRKEFRLPRKCVSPDVVDITSGHVSTVGSVAYDARFNK